MRDFIYILNPETSSLHSLQVHGNKRPMHTSNFCLCILPLRGNTVAVVTRVTEMLILGVFLVTIIGLYLLFVCLFYLSIFNWQCHALRNSIALAKPLQSSQTRSESRLLMLCCLLIRCRKSSRNRWSLWETQTDCWATAVMK